MLTKNPESLATALGTIRLKAARNGGVFALSASGADGRDAPLMGRLKRLMGTQASSMRKGTTRGLAAAIMLVGSTALVMMLGTTASQAHPDKRALEVLAGAGTKVYKHNGNSFMIVEDGSTYNTDGSNSLVKRGKIYAHKKGYSYGSHRQDGKTYVVKTNQSGTSHIQINGNWYNVNNRPQMNIVPPPIPPTQPLPPTPPTTNYWVSDQDWQANENRIERANERREAALKRATEARELATELREETLEQAKQQRKQAKKQRKRAAKQRKKAMEQAEYSRAEANKNRGRYEKMRTRLIPVLKADGYLPKPSSKVTIKMAGDDIFINGKLLPDAEEKEYCDIISDYVKRKNDVTKIVIKPDYLHVNITRNNSNSTHTYNE